MTYPVISVIVPVYNDAAYLEECIHSILAQDFTNIEVILVDDGSVDGSGDICDWFTQKDNRVKVIHKDYGGVSSARNVGLKNSHGEYIGFVDSDDRINKFMYKELYRLCHESGSDIAICQLGREINGKLINNNKGNFVLEMDNKESLVQLFKGELFRFSLCNKLFKKSCFNKVYFPEGRIHEDLSTTYKLFANSKKAIFTNNIGYIYIKRENSILTSRFNEKRLDAFIGWDEILTFMKGKYVQLYKEIITCYVFWVVDNIFFILDQVKNKKERDNYLCSIQNFVRKNFKDILKNDSLSLVYKSFFILFNFNFKILIITDSLKRILDKIG